MSLLSDLIEEQQSESGTPATPATVATQPVELAKESQESRESRESRESQPYPFEQTADDLQDTLVTATAESSITPDELHAELSAGDVIAWQTDDIGPDNLRALAQAMQDGRDRQTGRIPDSYEAIATCNRCGPVWLFTDGTVESCPWCINRMAGWPIPRPRKVACIDCRHFQRSDHPHLGRCGARIKPDNPTGQWWDTDRHGCGRWLLIDSKDANEANPDKSPLA